MTILLLRHAHAGSRRDWHGDDRTRPLSEEGRAQAAAVVDQYAGRPIDRILTSPSHRCVQTVVPLAEARGLPVEEDDAIAEGAPLDGVRRLIGRLAGSSAVLCTHGDVIESLMTDLRHQGVAMTDELQWHKASTWVLNGAPTIRDAALLPPPA